MLSEWTCAGVSGAAERGRAGESEGAAALAAVAGVAPDAEAEDEAGRHSAAMAAEDFRRGREAVACTDDDEPCGASAWDGGSSGCSRCCCSAWPCCCKYASCMCSCSAGLTRSKLSSCCRSLDSLMLVRRREAGEMNERDCSAEDEESSTGVPGATPPCGRAGSAGAADEAGPVEAAPADTSAGADADPGPDAGGHSIRREMALTNGYICCRDAAPAPTAAPSVTGPPAETAARCCDDVGGV